MKLTISEAAKALDISIDTLRRWDKAGIIRSTRNERSHRLFDLDEIKRVHAKKTCRDSSSAGSLTVHKRAKTRFRSIDLFAGAGGTALGLENAGFNHQLLCEIDDIPSQTLKKNRPNWNVVTQDVHEVDFSTFKGKVDLVEGGFPCQAFSYAGQSKGFGDPRGTLFFEFARAISETMPKVFLGENVRGLLTHDEGKTLQTMLHTLSNIRNEDGLGYRFGIALAKSQYFDVPQKRERLFIVGIRTDLDSPILFPKERDYIISLWEAIGDYPKGPGIEYPDHKRKIMELIPEGGYWRDLPDNLQREYLGGSYHLSGGKTGMARRLSWDEPSLTLTCSPAQKQTERCHPSETRPLNTREYARIQTFPDDWEFVGSTHQIYKQIGNAVPVNLAFHIGRGLIHMLNGTTTDDFVELVDLSDSADINLIHRF